MNQNIILVGAVLICAMSGGNDAFPTDNRKNVTVEASRDRRAVPLIPIVAQLAKGGVLAATAYCAKEPMCCVANVASLADIGDGIGNWFDKTVDALNPWNWFG